MRAEDFFEIIDGIDDDIILDVPELTDEEPTKIVIESKAAPFWKIALSAACLICVLFSGVYVVAGIKTGILSNSGANAPASSGESLPENSLGLYADAGLPDKNRFSTGEKAGDCIYTEPCFKNNERGHAVVYIDECYGITEDEPIYISVRADVGGNSVCVSETIRITRSEPQVHIIRYAGLYDKRVPLRLVKEQDPESGEYNDNAVLSGYWEP